MYSVSVRSENWKLNLLMNLMFSEVYGREGTRRERLKSALYLSLKKTWKKLEIFEKKFSFGKCRVVPKNVKGGTLFDL